MANHGQWVSSSGSNLPAGAVRGGQDKDGGHIYVGRAWHEGDLLPAKVCPSHGVAFVCYGGQEISKYQFDVLCHANVSWKESGHGQVPPDAVHCGRTASGEPLYIGRTLIDGTLTIGKVHPSHGCLYIPYGNEERSFKVYEVLIYG